jgi:UDP-2-acetamido-3-amino-2,3-dideoxy-glucuronate N-acetyltransferase
MTKVAVVGCGHWGKNLVRNFAELGALIAISDPNEVLVARCGAEYDVPVLNYDAILASDCDGVVIAAPAPLHASLSQKAFAAGKHVYVEKPLAMTLNEADEMIAAGLKADRQLMVGHLLQYHPVFARLRDMVRQGELGALQYIYSNRLSHDISMILALAGQKVKSVRCEATSTLQPGISDTASLHIDFEGGLNCHVYCSWLHPYKEQKLVVIGSAAMAVFDDTQPWDKKLAIYRHGIDASQVPPMLEKADVTYVRVPEGEPLKAECQYFLDLMAGQVGPLTDGEEGRRVLEVLAAASASDERGEAINA